MLSIIKRVFFRLAETISMAVLAGATVGLFGGYGIHGGALLMTAAFGVMLMSELARGAIWLLVTIIASIALVARFHLPRIYDLATIPGPTLLFDIVIFAGSGFGLFIVGMVLHTALESRGNLSWSAPKLHYDSFRQLVRVTLWVGAVIGVVALLAKRYQADDLWQKGIVYGAIGGAAICLLLPISEDEITLSNISTLRKIFTRWRHLPESERQTEEQLREFAVREAERLGRSITGTSSTTNEQVYFIMGHIRRSEDEATKRTNRQ